MRPNAASRGTSSVPTGRGATASRYAATASAGAQRRSISKVAPGRSARIRPRSTRRGLAPSRTRRAVLNLDLLRREPDRVRRAAGRRGIGTEFVERILELDRERRAAITAVETLKA